MTASRQIELAVEELGTDRVFTISDLAFPPEWWENIRIKLSRMVKQGKLVKLSPGKFYRPRMSILGPVPPSTENLVKDLLYKDDELEGYLTGISIWDSMGLTSQFSSTIVIGLNRRKDAIMRDGRRIQFIIQPNPIIKDDIPLFRILDSVKYIKSIPDTTVSLSVRRLQSIIQALSSVEIERLVNLAFKYPPRVRALIGAMIESLGYDKEAAKLKKSLNHLSEYKIGIESPGLSNLSNWKIV